MLRPRVLVPDQAGVGHHTLIVPEDAAWIKGGVIVYGITIWWPRNANELDESSSPQWNDFDYYRNYLEFSALTRWDDFLEAFAV